jgi:uncharacterized protein YecE (DUF72 family)
VYAAAVVSEQLDMFDRATSSPGLGVPNPSKRGLELASLPESVYALAKALPANLRMGTSSWSFPGWANLLWNREASPKTLASKGLPVYAQHPLLRTVGLDRTYYGPMTADELARLREGLPADFRLLVKAHAECTTVKFGDESWYRSRAGQRNELFLEPQYATEAVVQPYLDGLGEHGGVLLFQFPAQHVPGGARSFATRLEAFLSALPKGPQYAVEIRNQELLTPRYIKALDQVGATHCVVELPGMPEVDKQWEVSGGADRPALVMRWMLHRKHRYASAKQAYSPFDRLVDQNPAVRRAFADMILASTDRPAYVIVNNKAEGSSVLSILGLAEQLAALTGTSR